MLRKSIPALLIFGFSAAFAFLLLPSTSGFASGAASALWLALLGVANYERNVQIFFGDGAKEIKESQDAVYSISTSALLILFSCLSATVFLYYALMKDAPLSRVNLSLQLIFFTSFFLISRLVNAARVGR